MKISIAQIIVGRDIAANQIRMRAALESAQPGDWVVFPEGVLSGYFPDDEVFMSGLDAERIEVAIREIGSVVGARQCNCIFGTATFADGAWRNSVVVVTAGGQRHTYHKIELSGLDRRHFTPGAASEAIRAGDLSFGVLACRELLFPAMWSRLKQAGAQIVFHINNAIQPHDRIWNHIFVARAIEQGLFVCSVNNGAPPQELASYLIAPSGQVLLKTQTCCDDFVSAEINPGDAIPDLASRSDF
ncbi:MAG: carbon-nitrogen hydrolase family protein [Planctomycetota bacterium]